jgi:hypothetical protein
MGLSIYYFTEAFLRNIPRTIPLRRFHLQTEDGELRTNLLTQVAVDTFPFFDHNWGMISLGIELGGQLQHIPGAVLHTKPTPLAPILDDMDFPPGNPDFVKV